MIEPVKSGIQPREKNYIHWKGIKMLFTQLHSIIPMGKLSFHEMENNGFDVRVF